LDSENERRVIPFTSSMFDGFRKHILMPNCYILDVFQKNIILNAFTAPPPDRQANAHIPTIDELRALVV